MRPWPWPAPMHGVSASPGASGWSPPLRLCPLGCSRTFRGRRSWSFCPPLPWGKLCMLSSPQDHSTSSPTTAAAVSPAAPSQASSFATTASPNTTAPSPAPAPEAAPVPSTAPSPAPCPAAAAVVRGPAASPTASPGVTAAVHLPAASPAALPGVPAAVPSHTADSPPTTHPHVTAVDDQFAAAGPSGFRKFNVSTNYMFFSSL